MSDQAEVLPGCRFVDERNPFDDPIFIDYQLYFAAKIGLDFVRAMVDST
ncbi:hypothetical protein ABND49_10490 [Paenibacillus larvae]|nr:hypothetical protein [Paenibacillus larvae]